MAQQQQAEPLLPAAWQLQTEPGREPDGRHCGCYYYYYYYYYSSYCCYYDFFMLVHAAEPLQTTKHLLQPVLLEATSPTSRAELLCIYILSAAYILQSAKKDKNR